MKKLSICFVMMLACVILFHGCKKESSDSVDQDKIFTEYELFYDKNTDKTYARATFKFSNIAGTLLELESPSEVRFNNDILTITGLGYYEKQYAGPVTSGTFTWKDTEGNSFSNTISHKTIAFPATLDSISRAQAFELFWTGDSLASKENVTVVINGEHEGDVQTFYTASLNAKSIIFGLNQLQILPVGVGHCYMDRRYQPDLTQKTSAGGIITGRYKAQNKDVQLY